MSIYAKLISIFFLGKTQVEHPVTEMISSVDLIEEQIHVAMGGKLRYKQVFEMEYMKNMSFQNSQSF